MRERVELSIRLNFGTIVCVHSVSCQDGLFNSSWVLLGGNGGSGVPFRLDFRQLSC